jgi:hypothetical protein
MTKAFSKVDYMWFNYRIHKRIAAYPNKNYCDYSYASVDMMINPMVRWEVERQKTLR